MNVNSVIGYFSETGIDHLEYCLTNELIRDIGDDSNFPKLTKLLVTWLWSAYIAIKKTNFLKVDLGLNDNILR